MENILILKKVASKAGFANIPAAMDGIAIGDLIAVGDDKVLLGADTVLADLAGIRFVQFFTKLSTNTIRSTVPIDREEITRFNYQAPKAAVQGVTTLGGITAPLGLVIPSTGDTGLVLRNLSYNHTIAAERVSTSFTKKAAETAEAFIDRVVAEINLQQSYLTVPFVIAAKVVSGANLGITFTNTNSNVDFDLSLNGFLEGSSVVVTTQPVAPIGAGADILNMEKDFSRHRGYQGYAELGDLWYKQPTETSAGLTYKVSTIKWDGIAETPTSSFKAATNHLAFAVDSALDNGAVTVDVFLRLICNVAVTVIEETDVDATDNA